MTLFEAQKGQVWVNESGGAGGYALITEIEAWTTDGSSPGNQAPVVTLSTDETLFAAPASVTLSGLRTRPLQPEYVLIRQAQ